MPGIRYTSIRYIRYSVSGGDFLAGKRLTNLQLLPVVLTRQYYSPTKAPPTPQTK